MHCKMEFICITLFIKKNKKIFLSSGKKNEQSLIRVLALSCILALNTYLEYVLKVLCCAVNISDALKFPTDLF